MRFWTIQGYDLRTFKGPIDLSQGSYKDSDTIPPEQRKLYERIQTDQVVWCEQDEPYLCRKKKDQFLHAIDFDVENDVDVDDDNIFVVDTLAWCHIIGYDSRYIPKSDHVKLQYQADMSDGDVCKLEDEYLAAHLSDNLWCAVIKKKITRKEDQLLVKFPFDFSKIVSVKKIPAK